MDFFSELYSHNRAVIACCHPKLSLVAVMEREHGKRRRGKGKRGREIMTDIESPICESQIRHLSLIESTLNLFSVLLSFHHVSIFPSIPFSFTAHQCFFSWRETKQGCSLNAEVLPIISPYTVHIFSPLFSFSVSHSLAFCYGRS